MQISELMALLEQLKSAHGDCKVYVHNRNGLVASEDMSAFCAKVLDNESVLPYDESELEPECFGHPAGLQGPMGTTSYCDGSCNLDKARNEWRNASAALIIHIHD